MKWEIAFFKIDTHDPASWQPIRNLTRDAAEGLRGNPDYFELGVYAVARPQSADTIAHA